jgi:hypothetical protein
MHGLPLLEIIAALGFLWAPAAYQKLTIAPALLLSGVVIARMA